MNPGLCRNCKPRDEKGHKPVSSGKPDTEIKTPEQEHAIFWPSSPRSEKRGFFMERLAVQTLERGFNREQRVHDNLKTWLAETLHGTMRTLFEYRFDGRELYARDGGELAPIFDDAITAAEEIARCEPNLAFELRRRQIERSEYEAMLEMARGELPNTMVVVSDFPEELMDATEDVGGYNVHRKQAMLRVITRHEDGRLLMRSQSLDGSNRRALEAMYTALGYRAEPGELLGQRMHLDLPDDDREFLTDYLMGVYDRELSAQYGGLWYAGIQGANPFNTYEFVLAQEDLLGTYLKLSQGEANTQLLYGVAAAMQERYDLALKGRLPFAAMEFNPHSMHTVYGEMQAAGQRATAAGKAFNGCGASIGPSGQMTAANEIGELGYGNKTDEETKYKFDRKMHCVVCQAPPKKDEPKKMCGPCGICRACDTNLKKRSR